jgi:hypothetical protein
LSRNALVELHPVLGRLRPLLGGLEIAAQSRDDLSSRRRSMRRKPKRSALTMLPAL